MEAKMNDIEASIVRLQQLEAEEKRQQEQNFDNVFEERKKQPTNKKWNYFDDIFERRI